MTRSHDREPDAWILSRSRRLHSTRRLCEAADALGLALRVVDPTRVVPGWDASGPFLADGRGRLHPPAVVLPRLGARSGRTSTAVVEQLEAMGVTTLNPAAALWVARDKLWCAQRLVAAGLPVPAAAVVRPGMPLGVAVEAAGGFPVVVKPVRGSHGVGVMLAADAAQLQAQVGALAEAGEDVLVQRFIAEGAGVDTRVLVVGGRAVAAMERRARRGDFRANVHQGARTCGVPLTAALRAMAERTARAVGLGVAGVDLMHGADGPVVLEVNASPGLRGIESATGVDVAGAIIRLVARHCAARGVRRSAA
ncbi:MAG: RimK family alpha-L-glutamate ligase [Deltaproteobacteria bacterium]|nr:RimK family alpha-L-glutamate ligase [Deltaproteobacteria bacterium]